MKTPLNFLKTGAFVEKKTGGCSLGGWGTCQDFDSLD